MIFCSVGMGIVLRNLTIARGNNEDDKADTKRILIPLVCCLSWKGFCSLPLSSNQFLSLSLYCSL